MIVIILGIIVGVISLIAALLIPSKAKIERSETAKYKSSKYFIYGAGASALFIGILVITLFAMNQEEMDLPNILRIVFFLAVGIGLIVENIRKSKFLAQYEIGAVPVAAVPMGVEVAAQVVPAMPPIPQQQIGVKAMPPVQAQPQAQTQQVGIKATPTVQARPQAQQVGVKSTPSVQPQPQVVAPQPQPAAPPPGRIIVIKCPKCQGSMQINTAMLGQKMKCPHCGVEGRIG